ncbi:MAG: hypothetical protein ACLUOI_35375 [Eisenbergiella sp.]
MNEELLMEVLSQSRKKYGCVSEIGRMTKELAEALSRNDKVSAQLLLEMRGEEMAKADTCEKNIRLLVEEAGIQDRERLECLLYRKGEDGKPEEESGQEAILVKQITDVNTKIRDILKNAITVDKVVSKRMAGEESFYKE